MAENLSLLAAAPLVVTAGSSVASVRLRPEARWLLFYNRSANGAYVLPGSAGYPRADGSNCFFLTGTAGHDRLIPCAGDELLYYFRSGAADATLEITQLRGGNGEQPASGKSYPAAEPVWPGPGPGEV